MLHATRTDSDITTAPRSARRLGRRALLSGAVLATAALAAPAIASAADTVVAPDPLADQISALDGTVVWVSGTFGKQKLMQLTADGIAPVKGAPQAKSYRSIDLGRDGKNRLVLTYQRCGASACKTLTDNLDGQRASFRHLMLKRCELTTAPARWRSRSAYGLLCRKTNNEIDQKRSGLYIKTAAGTMKRLPRPRDAAKFGISDIASVDLRGTDVAAVIADVYEYAFVQTTSGDKLRSIFAAASEGDSDQSARGLALGPGGRMHVLTTAAHAGDPNLALLLRVTGTCYERETLANPPGPEQEVGFRANDVAVDGSTIYLLVPGVGVITHEFAPAGACTPL